MKHFMQWIAKRVKKIQQNFMPELNCSHAVPCKVEVAFSDLPAVFTGYTTEYPASVQLQIMMREMDPSLFRIAASQLRTWRMN